MGAFLLCCSNNLWQAKEGVSLYITLCIELLSLRDRYLPFHRRSTWWASVSSPGIEAEIDESPMNSKETARIFPRIGYIIGNLTVGRDHELPWNGIYCREEVKVDG